jgi:WD40 repeat protein
LVTASDDQTARVWNARSGEAIVLQGHENGVTSASFSPDGKCVVTTSYDTTAVVWSAENGSQIAVLPGHNATVWNASFSPDGKG